MSRLIILKIIPRACVTNARASLLVRRLHDQKKNRFLQTATELKEASVKNLRLDKLKNFQDYKVKILDQKENVVNFALKKSTDSYNHYLRLVGLDKVKKAQERVLEIEEELRKAQIERRELDRRLKQKRDERQQLELQLRKIDRINDHELYLSVFKEESEVIKVEKQLEEQFREADENERQISSRFSDAIRDSQKEERVHTEHTKYFGYMWSLIGIVLGAVLTIIVNWTRNKDLISGIEKGVDKTVGTIHSKINGVDQAVKSLEQKLTEMLEKKIAAKDEAKNSWSWSSYVPYLGWGKKEEKSENADETQQGHSKTKILLGALGVCVLVIRIAIFGF